MNYSKRCDHWRPNGKRSAFSHRLVATCFGLACVAQTAQAIDVDAGDWTAPPPGKSLFLVYAQHAQRTQHYMDGNFTMGDTRLESDIFLLRYTRPIWVGGFVVNPQVVLPLGRLRGGGALSGLGKVQGAGDLLFTAPIWLINKPEERTYLAVAPFVFVPTGGYRQDRPLNLGENRWKYDLQLGYGTGLAKNFSVELTGDVLFYGTNDDYTKDSFTLKQKHLYQVQTQFIWHQPKGLSYALGLSKTHGGQSEVNGVKQQDTQGTSKLLLTASKFVTDTTQLLVSIGKDLRVLNGLKEDFRVNFRVLTIL